MRTIIHAMISIAIGVVCGIAQLCGCSSEARDRFRETPQRIQGGTPDNGDPAVALVMTQSQLCTGSLIAPNIILTAAHCAKDDTVVSATMDRQYTVDGQLVHPSFQGLMACPDQGYDLALLHLSEDVTTVSPLQLGTPISGDTCLAVGFGLHDQNAGTKYSGTSRITSVGTQSFSVSKVTGIADHGDSGGPLLCANVVVGVTSCGTDDSSQHTTAEYALVDTQWIAMTIADWKQNPPSPGPGPGPGRRSSIRTTRDGVQPWWSHAKR